jgi:hypothetical protein
MEIVRKLERQKSCCTRLVNKVDRSVTTTMNMKANLNKKNRLVPPVYDLVLLEMRGGSGTSFVGIVRCRNVLVVGTGIPDQCFDLGSKVGMREKLIQLL